MRNFRSPQGSAIKTLLIANIALFILQQFLEVSLGSDFLTDWFKLSESNIQSGYIWTLVSYAFLHGGYTHIIFNMLMLYFMGSAVQEDLNDKKTYTLYIVSAIGGGLAWYFLNNGDTEPLNNGYREPYVVGASGSVFAILIFFCCCRAEQRLTFLLFFIIPVTLKPKFLAWALVVWQLIFLPGELQGNTNIAYSAHLGGALTGFVYYWFFFRNSTSSTFTDPGPSSYGQSTSSSNKTSWFQNTFSSAKKTTSKASKSINFSLNVTNKESLQAEVDRILDKINDNGFGSLTDKEKKTLDKAREILKK